MRSVVVDANVAAKWFLPASGEPLTSEAADLFERFSIGQLGMIVPDLFWAELGSVFWKAIRQSRYTKVAAESVLRDLKERRVRTVPSLAVLETAFDIAVLFDRSVYDALYVALASVAETIFVTADERLVNALGSRLPVRWLGAAHLI
ncbi:MAG TPA: type II toxin-antitoxin system VapC family toxin [Candidatus Acidoferrales bacterium]|jgi:predicted nucleic acid-binding protein|nr:type II toxin-antitoxin system VapC family toxin [Candidatus Acidoferrales bacterium]